MSGDQQGRPADPVEELLSELQPEEDGSWP